METVWCSTWSKPTTIQEEATQGMETGVDREMEAKKDEASHATGDACDPPASQKGGPAFVGFAGRVTSTTWGMLARNVTACGEPVSDRGNSLMVESSATIEWRRQAFRAAEAPV